MKVNIVYVKISDGVRTEIKYEDMTEEERKEQAIRSKIRFFRAMGYEPVDYPPEKGAAKNVI